MKQIRDKIIIGVDKNIYTKISNKITYTVNMGIAFPNSKIWDAMRIPILREIRIDVLNNIINNIF